MEFLGHLPPQGDLLNKYDRHASYQHQPESGNASDQIPQVFLDAMSVRESVFVEEQKCRLEEEFDADDPRSWHWVCYASVSKSGSSGPAVQRGFGASAPPADRHDRRKSTATASKLPVGTIRMVPPPHPPHPEPGSSNGIDNSEGSREAPSQVPSSVKTHTPGTRDVSGIGWVDEEEPYVKLGRIAVLSTYRRLGLAKLLLDAACDWASKHPLEIVPKVDATARERAHARQRSGEIPADRSIAEAMEPNTSPEETIQELPEVPLGPWKGLVLVHAQSHLEGLYNKWGFHRDPGLGEWTEEGIKHIGMWRRLHVKDEKH